MNHLVVLLLAIPYGVMFIFLSSKLGKSDLARHQNVCAKRKSCVCHKRFLIAGCLVLVLYGLFDALRMHHYNNALFLLLGSAWFTWDVMNYPREVERRIEAGKSGTDS